MSYFEEQQENRKILLIMLKKIQDIIFFKLFGSINKTSTFVEWFLKFNLNS
jgi:hypothetical protein